ncbi:MAG: Ig-like domain-containing protein, partial [Firmicutes bacterium]|nr:Ig-like domain-containing protein [Bacillota bacterium]
MKRKIIAKKAFALLLVSAMTTSAIPVWANYGGENPDDEDVVIEQDFQTETLEMAVGEEVDVNDYLYYTADSYDWDYDSSDVSVKKGIITAKSEGYTTVTAMHEYQVVAFKIGIEGGEVSNTEYISVTVGVGGEEGLGQYIELGTSEYSWSSDKSSIASVTGGGVLTGKSKGSTKVYAKRTKGTSCVFNVTVEGGGSSKTSEKSITYNVGDIDYLSSYVGNDVSDYEWTSSNSSVADISSSGKVVALKTGSATIKAVPYYVSTEYVFYITVKSSSSSVEKQDITMYADNTKDLSGYVSGSAKNYDWTSDDKSIATVSSSGIVSAKKKGTVKIYVYESGRTNEKYIFTVIVKSNSSSSSSSSIDEKYTIYMNKNDSVDISDYLAKSAASYDWETSNKEICKVSDGKLKAIDTGSTTVKALGSKNYQFNVKVNKNYSNYAVNLKVNGTLDLGKYLNNAASKYNISYYKTGIVTVKNNELVGQKNGTAYVIFENKSSNEVVQLMVDVSGTATVTETTTETTVSKPVTTAQPKQSTPSANTVSDKGFKDISHRQWAVSAINNMAAKGYINGRSADIFAPDDNCSKGDFTIVLTKMLGIENNSYTGGFDDVTSDKYYAKYVNVAREYGICAGVVNNTFKPQSAITREEVMYMVYMGLKLK